MNFKALETPKKLRGGYYTPPDLAHFLVSWVEKISPARTLEPSCGDGVFLEAMISRQLPGKVLAFELDSTEAEKSRQHASKTSDMDVQNADFLEWSLKAMKKGKGKSKGKNKGTVIEPFDAVVGNPPFIRYQYLPEPFQDCAQRIFEHLNCKFTKHTNAWVSFILASFELLRPGGRLAMVVPAEIIHVMHAQSLRSWLGAQARRLVIVDPEELWFEGTLQGAVLLLAEKKHRDSCHSEGLGIHSVRDREFLKIDSADIFDGAKPINGKSVEGKWTRALLPNAIRSLLDELTEARSVKSFDEVAQVDVGIVTGANKYFLVEDDVVRKFKLQKWAHPMFGRSEHCPGVIYDEAQHCQNSTSGKPTNFIWFRDADAENTITGSRYIRQGESQDLHKRYKCRTRRLWYSVPSVYATDVGMLKRSHDTPRLIHNKLRAFTTDTAYRINAIEGTAEQLVYGFLNALTALSAEVEGRHYGGGVLELVPSEIEKLLLPSPARIKPDIRGLDKAVRTMPINAVLETQSKKVLGEIGLSRADQNELLAGWRLLRNRRHRVSTEAS